MKDAIKLAEGEIIPALRERAAEFRGRALRQLEVFSGEAKSDGYAYYQAMIAPAKITVAENMVLSYFIKPMNLLSKQVHINLLFNDNEYLSDKLEMSVLPGETDEWTRVQADLSPYIGLEITGVYAAFSGDTAGPFAVWVDDILIEQR